MPSWNPTVLGGPALPHLLVRQYHDAACRRGTALPRIPHLERPGSVPVRSAQCCGDRWPPCGAAHAPIPCDMTACDSPNVSEIELSQVRTPRPRLRLSHTNKNDDSCLCFSFTGQANSHGRAEVIQVSDPRAHASILIMHLLWRDHSSTCRTTCHLILLRPP